MSNDTESVTCDECDKDIPVAEDGTFDHTAHAGDCSRYDGGEAPPDVHMDQVWWIVTLREDGDDEDSLFIVEGDDEDMAVASATETLQDVAGCKSEEIYINHVVRCVCTARPEHVRMAP